MENERKRNRSTLNRATGRNLWGLVGALIFDLQNRHIDKKMNIESGVFNLPTSPIFFNSIFLGKMIFEKSWGKKFQKALLLSGE